MSQLSRQSYPATAFPEKVLQFGLTYRLRALPDWLIDQANRRGSFKGSVVAVGLDYEADTLAHLVAQEGSYSVHSPDLAEPIIVSAISRVLSADSNWDEVLRLARKPGLQIILTDAYVPVEPENIFQHPPRTFAAKLTAFLYERFRDMGGSRNRGLVILPLEAMPDNGLRLREAVEHIATHNELGKLFLKWLKFHVRFCNTIAEQPASSAPAGAGQTIPADVQGYTDALPTPTDPHWRWAIEGDERVRKLLGFADAESGIVIEEDISFQQEQTLASLPKDLNTI